MGANLQLDSLPSDISQKKIRFDQLYVMIISEHDHAKDLLKKRKSWRTLNV